MGRSKLKAECSRGFPNEYLSNFGNLLVFMGSLTAIRAVRASGRKGDLCDHRAKSEQATKPHLDRHEAAKRHHFLMSKSETSLEVANSFPCSKSFLTF